MSASPLLSKVDSKEKLKCGICMQADPQAWQATSAGDTVHCHSDAVNAVTLSNLTQAEADQLWEVSSPLRTLGATSACDCH